MATSPLFGWEEPDDVDLVKDGAAAIRTLGNAIDTSMGDLLGGTSGQVLSKNSNTNMDFTWVTPDDANAIQNAIVDAKGDLIAATAADTPARIAVGTNGQVLTADSTAATGLAWATPSAGSSNVAGKNAVLNSNFSIWQRGTSISPAGATDYTADRWTGYFPTNTTVSRQVTGDTTNLPFVQYCARVQRNNGSTNTTVRQFTQSLETVNSIPFAGKTATVSFYARAGANFSSSSNVLNVKAVYGTGTDQNYTGTYTGATAYVDQNATLTTTWQRFSYSGSVVSTATELALQFQFTPSGTAGAADYFEITGVQLEIASSASAYSPNASTQQAELAACQRYFYAANGSNRYSISQGQATSSTAAQTYVTFPVPMRTSATFAFVGAASNLILITSTGGAASSPTSVSMGFGAENLARIDLSGSSGLTAGNFTALQYSSGSPSFQFSAEL